MKFTGRQPVESHAHITNSPIHKRRENSLDEIEMEWNRRIVTQVLVVDREAERETLARNPTNFRENNEKQ